MIEWICHVAGCAVDRAQVDSASKYLADVRHEWPWPSALVLVNLVAVVIGIIAFVVLGRRSK